MAFWAYCTLLVAGLSGLDLSVYLTAVFLRVQRGEHVKCFDGSCPIVMQTPDARMLGFPNFYLAIPFYSVLVVFAGLRLAGHAEWLFWPVAAAAGLSLAASVRLAYSLLVKLKQP